MYINIEWDGPFSLEEVKALKGPADYGIYQVYGTHPVYGSDVLLYIGQANQQYFGKRIPQHDKWLNNQDAQGISIYVGRLGGNKQVSDERWSTEVEIAEKLLIYSHKPALNSSAINSIREEKIPIEAHVFNWLSHKNILPEVSAFRYFATDEEFFDGYSKYIEKKHNK